MHPESTIMKYCTFEIKGKYEKIPLARSFEIFFVFLKFGSESPSESR
jgi:hypothetical protein